MKKALNVFHSHTAEIKNTFFLVHEVSLEGKKQLSSFNEGLSVSLYLTEPLKEQ